MSLSNQARIAILSASLVALTGCATGLRSNKEFFSQAHIENHPVVEPTRSVSGFSDGLACMDKMLRDQHAATTLITSKNIPDVTGGVPVAIKEMIITSLSQMSRTSGAFRYVDFEVDYSTQDTVQVLTQTLLASGQMNIQAPTLYVSGSVSFMDKNIIVAKRDVGIDHPDGGIGLSRDRMASQLGLELHLGDFFSRSLLPGVEAANEIALGGSGSGMDVGARIDKAGVDFTIANDYSQGVGPTVRALVDLSMIELIGKWARVPYWQCVSIDQNHPEFQRQMYQWYRDMGAEERIRFMQTGLRGEGYYSGEIDGRYSDAMRQALARYQSDHDAVPGGNINFETYERLAKDYVRKDGTGRFMRIGWGGSDDDRWAANLANEPRNGKPAWGAQPSPPIIEVSLGRDPLIYGLGEALQADLLVSRTAYLYCFYRDAAGVMTQIYPNPMQSDQPVKAGEALRIPDPRRGANFVIEMNRPGQEELLCLAADVDLASLWPDSLRRPALQPIQQIGSLEEIAALSEKALPGKVGTRRVQWTVDKHL